MRYAQFTTIDVDMEKSKMTPEGFLMIRDVKLARTGVHEYLALEIGDIEGFEPTDVVRVYRPPEEVFKQESMESFAMKPVTNDHPSNMLTAQNAMFYTVGSVGSKVSEKDSHLVADLLQFTDENVIEAIQNGKVEISNGYFVDYTFESGTTPDGQAYDAVQSNIVGNHVALVEKGRCGPTCNVLDSKTGTNQPCKCNNGDSEPMKTKVNIAGVDCEVDSQTAQLITKALKDAKADAAVAAADAEAKITKLEGELKDAKEQISKLEGERDAAVNKAKEAGDAEPTGDVLQKAVDAHLILIDQVKTLNPSFDFTGKTTDQIIKEVVVDANPTVDMSDKDATYLRASFDTMVRLAKDGGADAVLQSLRGGAGDDDDNTNVVSADAARKARDEKNAKRFNLGG